MTDIAQENNSVPRTFRDCPKPIAPKKEGKLAARHRRGNEILAEFCQSQGITPEHLRARSQSILAVGRRRKFARICAKEGIGRTIIGYLLERDTCTVAAYLHPELVRKIVQRN